MCLYKAAGAARIEKRTKVALSSITYERAASDCTAHNRQRFEHAAELPVISQVPPAGGVARPLCSRPGISA